MVRPFRRTHSMARIKRITPGRRQSTIYKRRRPTKARCGVCGGVLGGVPALRPSQMVKIPKVQKRPERQYGGRVCASCLKKEIIKSVLGKAPVPEVQEE
jgi:large subunit ribosomal protein L34e